MRIVHALLSAGLTDPGLQRSVNEDRFHQDASRGIFIVVDGVGGQAAGGKAADVALSILKERLERETGTVKDRLREAITVANNEICRLAASRPEWHGMACVLTAAIVNEGRATIGHVGDTRLYKLRGQRIEKITRDHSPVGEREDANELTEQQAMRHPRRNEVYRDVGSEIHRPSDPEFVDIAETAFEADAALLLCSDGLTDLIPSATIAEVVRKYAGMPQVVVNSLVELANGAGGKDNVTVVYVEGEAFVSNREAAGNRQPENKIDGAVSLYERKRLVLLLSVLFLVGGFALGLTFRPGNMPALGTSAASPPPASLPVQPGESIAGAIHRAIPGTTVTVEPGEYLERIVLKEGVRLVSRVPRGAIIRLPISGSDADTGPAVLAAGAAAEIRGFRIVGDAATPLAIGMAITGPGISVLDVEVTGATTAGIEVSGGASAAVIGSDIHDNPGAAMIIRAGANLRGINNVFTRNGTSEHAAGNVVIEPGGIPVLRGNIFAGISPDGFITLDQAARSALKTLNWFPSTSARRGRQ
jgi:PPM family protein phosphatase